MSGDPKSVPANDPVGVAPTDYVIRQLIAFGMDSIRKQIAGDPVGKSFLDEMFKLWPAAADGTTVGALVKKYIMDHPNIKVVVNYPRGDIGLPFIACVNAADQEDPSFTFLGDYTGTQRFGLLGGGKLPGGRFAGREQRGVGTKNVTSIYIGSDDPDLTTYLYTIIRFILFSNKLALDDKYGIRNLVLNGQDLQWQAEFFPTFCYLKVLSAVYGSMFTYNLSEEATLLVRVVVTVDAGDGAVPVPDPNDAG